VVLDVGGDIGALVVLADPELAGAEIEISPVESATRAHVPVYLRRLGARVVHAAVYPDLPAGDYQLWRSDGQPGLRVSVRGGVVTEACWPHRTT
jgi:hypothetical protein